MRIEIIKVAITPSLRSTALMQKVACKPFHVYEGSVCLVDARPLSFPLLLHVERLDPRVSSTLNSCSEGLSRLDLSVLLK
jgi:hypothetical protein